MRVNAKEMGEAMEQLRRDLVAGPICHLNAAMSTIAAVGNQTAQAIHMAEDLLRRSSEIQRAADEILSLKKDLEERAVELERRLKSEYLRRMEAFDEKKRLHRAKKRRR